jgi:RNA polymerase sigma-70 factor (ECF subfamily)
MLVNSAKEQKDEEIVLKVQSGQIDYFELLVFRYEDKIKRYGRKFLSGYEDIEDIVQQVFLKAYVNIKSFNTSRKFSSWIYRIAHNEFVNAIKKKKKEPLPFFNPDVIFPHPLSKEPADKKTKEDDIKKIVDECLNKLSPKHREVVVLYYFEEMSYKDMADILRIPISTIGVRIKRAKNIMRKICQTEL